MVKVNIAALGPAATVDRTPMISRGAATALPELILDVHRTLISLSSWLLVLTSTLSCSSTAVMAEPVAVAPPSEGLRISLNLKPFLSLPRRLLERIREVDGILDQQTMAHHRERTIQSSTLGGMHNESHGPPPPGTMTPMPGPWGFFASGYAVVLFAMVCSHYRQKMLCTESCLGATA